MDRRQKLRARVTTAIGAIGLLCLVAGVKLYANRDRGHGETVVVPSVAPSAGEADPTDVPHATHAELLTITRDVCKRMACGPQPDAAIQDCVDRQLATAKTELARDTVAMLDQRAIARCASQTCQAFQACYFASLRELGGSGAAAP